MYTIEQINQVEAESSKKSHGLHVFNKLRDLRKEGLEKHKSRWFWELLQNAKDSVNNNQKVSIEVEITNDFVRFSHTGNPFQLEEIIQLIVQGSTKSEQENKTGRFGTGFISTYILSEKVRIEAPLVDGTRFDFILDREANDEKEFLAKQDACKLEFANSLKPIQNERDHKTIFTYPIDKDRKEVALKGLEQVEKFLPFALSFNKQIEKISVSIDNKPLHAHKTELKDVLVGQTMVKPIEVNIFSKPDYDSTYLVLCVEQDDFQTCILLQKEEGLSVIHLSNSYPRFYFSFPLLGTTNYGFPLVINSEKFSLESERKDIFLGSKADDKDIINNKKIVESAVKQLPTFIEYLKLNDTKDIEYLFDLRPFAQDGLDNVWLDSVKRNCIEQIQTLSVFKYDEEFKSLCQLRIQVDRDEEVRRKIQSLLKDLKNNFLPTDDKLNYWYHVLDGFATLYVKNSYELDYAYNLSKLCSELDSIISFPVFEQNFFVPRFEKTPFDWLSTFYRLVQEQAPQRFNEYRLLLNQANCFVAKNDQLKIDGIKDDTLLEIDEMLGKKIKEYLIHPGVTLPAGVCPTEQKDSFVDHLVQKFNSKTEAAFGDIDIDANAKFLNWLIEAKDIERIKSIKILVPKKDSNVGKDSFNVTAKQKILAPKVFWQEQFPIYSSILKSESCLHDNYNKYLTAANYSWLEQQQLIHCSPLVRRKERVSKVEFKKLLKNVTQYSQVEGEKDEGDFFEVEFIDFAHFVTSEGYVLSNISYSLTRKILSFILLEAPFVDIEFDSTYDKILSSGDTVQIKRSIWPGRLRDVQWVMAKSTSEIEGAYRPETPSSKNLAAIIKDDTNLKKALQTSQASSIIGALSISVADLLRSTLLDEQEQIQWDTAFTSLLSTDLKPLEAIRLIKDPRTISDFRQREVERIIVGNNQKTGKNFEVLFRRLIENNYPSLKIDRRPWGSDYIIEYDILNGDGSKEEIYDIAGHLVELKATKRQYAAMTVLQAETAVKPENRDHYSLIVLELTKDIADEQDILDNAYVITDIGYQLESKYIEYTEVVRSEIHLQQEVDAVQVVKEQGQVRFYLQQKLWRSGKTLQEFINGLHEVKLQS